jgi:4-hydroxybenzoate polyprenyltransferase
VIGGVVSAGMARPGRWRLYVRLGRVSNLPTVWTNVLAGIVLARGTPTVGTVLVLGTALSLFYVGGMFLNDAFDREVDARERPERPIPAALIGAPEVFTVGAALVAAGIALVAIAAGVRSPAVAAALALATAIVVYDAWHKRNPLSPLLMGLCRVLVYVTAGLAVAARVTTALAGGALALLAYLIGLTYVAKQENLSEPRKLWPLGALVVPLVYAIPATLAGGMTALAWLALLVAVLAALRLLRGRAPRRIPRAVAVMIAGISLVDALLIARAGAPGPAALALLGFPATLALQRWVSGT